VILQATKNRFVVVEMEQILLQGNPAARIPKSVFVTSNIYYLDFSGGTHTPLF